MVEVIRTGWSDCIPGHQDLLLLHRPSANHSSLSQQQRTCFCQSICTLYSSSCFTTAVQQLEATSVNTCSWCSAPLPCQMRLPGTRKKDITFHSSSWRVQRSGPMHYIVRTTLVVLSQEQCKACISIHAHAKITAGKLALNCS